jgi:type II secretory pathway component PulF
MIVALSHGVVVAWWVALGVGLAIALVVWALLEILRRSVRSVDEAVTRVWTSGKLLAQNTQATHLLLTTKARGLDLLEELERHAALAERGER